MRIYATLLCVVLLLGLASAGYCQWWWMGVMNAGTTARWAGMGGAGIAAANDAAAIDFNPANLANLEMVGADTSGRMSWGGAATWGGGSFEDLSLKIGARSNQGDWGAGFSFERPSDSGWHDNIWSLGYGARLGSGGSSWGVSAIRDDEFCSCGNVHRNTWVNAGYLHALPQGVAPPIKIGLLITNLLEDENDPRFFNLGVAVPVGEKLLLAADAWDVTDEWERFFNFGAELAVAPDWCVRAGRMDTDWTVGAGYRKARLSLDVAFIRADDFLYDNQWLVSGNFPF